MAFVKQVRIQATARWTAEAEVRYAATTSVKGQKLAMEWLWVARRA